MTVPPRDASSHDGPPRASPSSAAASRPPDVDAVPPGVNVAPPLDLDKDLPDDFDWDTVQPDDSQVDVDAIVAQRPPSYAAYAEKHSDVGVIPRGKVAGGKDGQEAREGKGIGGEAGGRDGGSSSEVGKRSKRDKKREKEKKREGEMKLEEEKVKLDEGTKRKEEAAKKARGDAGSSWGKKKKKKKKPKVTFRCDMCSVSVYDEGVWQTHLNGKQHKTNSRRAELARHNLDLEEHAKKRPSHAERAAGAANGNEGPASRTEALPSRYHDVEPSRSPTSSERIAPAPGEAPPPSAGTGATEVRSARAASDGGRRRDELLGASSGPAETSSTAEPQPSPNHLPRVPYSSSVPGPDPVAFISVDKVVPNSSQKRQQAVGKDERPTSTAPTDTDPSAQLRSLVPEMQASPTTPSRRASKPVAAPAPLPHESSLQSPQNGKNRSPKSTDTEDTRRSPRDSLIGRNPVDFGTASLALPKKGKAIKSGGSSKADGRSSEGNPGLPVSSLSGKSQANTTADVAVITTVQNDPVADSSSPAVVKARPGSSAASGEVKVAAAGPGAPDLQSGRTALPTTAEPSTAVPQSNRTAIRTTAGPGAPASPSGRVPLPATAGPNVPVSTSGPATLPSLRSQIAPPRSAPVDTGSSKKRKRFIGPFEQSQTSVAKDNGRGEGRHYPAGPTTANQESLRHDARPNGDRRRRLNDSIDLQDRLAPRRPAANSGAPLDNDDVQPRPRPNNGRPGQASTSDKAGMSVPVDWLRESMPLSEWRELRRTVFDKGSDVEQLAYKMLQELLLSPAVGINFSALKPFSQGVQSALEKQRVSEDGKVRLQFEDFPEALRVRDVRYRTSSPEFADYGMDHGDEEKAMRLVNDNIHYMFNMNEDSDPIKGPSRDNYPPRGSFGIKQNRRGPGVAIAGELPPRYADSVCDDGLFQKILAHLKKEEARRPPH